MDTPPLKIDKTTRKLWRLQAAQRYDVKKVGENSFEVLAGNEGLRAFVDTMGAIIVSDGGAYDKTALYKLRNYCDLLQHYVLGIEKGGNKQWILKQSE